MQPDELLYAAVIPFIGYDVIVMVIGWINRSFLDWEKNAAFSFPSILTYLAPIDGSCQLSHISLAF